MKRRTLLAAAAGSATALAGCIEGTMPGGDPVGDGDAGGDGDDDGGDGDGGDGDDGAGDVSVVDSEFEVADASCGTETDEAAVTRASAESRIVVEGTISAPDPCHTAELGDVRYDAGADEVRVAVTTAEKPGTDACAQCIAEMEYRAVVTFDGGLPASVVVSHDDEVVRHDDEVVAESSG